MFSLGNITEISEITVFSVTLKTYSVLSKKRKKNYYIFFLPCLLIISYFIHLLINNFCLKKKNK